jgi:hypothetical protein
VAQQEDRMPGIERPAVQPPCRGKVEARRRIARFEQDCRQPLERRSLLGDPERVEKPSRLRNQHAGWLDAVQEQQARRIGMAGLAKTVRHTDPEKRCRPSFYREAGESQHETGRGPRIPRGSGMDLGQPRGGNTATERRIETLGTGLQDIDLQLPLTAAQQNVLSRPIELFGGTAFYLRDLMAQGRNGVPRQGRRGHGDSSSRNCSCYVLIDSRGRPGSQATPDKNLFLQSLMGGSGKG